MAVGGADKLAEAAVSVPPPDSVLNGAEATPERILAAAAGLFRVRGYGQSTTRELAELLGMKKASLYHYVKSKEDLLYAISVNSLDHIDAGVAAAVQGSDSTDLLQRVIRVHTLSALQNRDQHAVMLAQIGSLSEPRRKDVIRRRDRYEARLRAVIEAEQKAGRLRNDIDPKYLCLSLLNLLNWTIFWYQPGGSLSESEIADLLTTVFLFGGATGTPFPESIRAGNGTWSARSDTKKGGR